MFVIEESGKGLISAESANPFGMIDMEMTSNNENINLQEFIRRLRDLITWNLFLEFARVTASCYGI